MSEKGASLPSVRSGEQSSQAQQEVEWVDGGQKKKKKERWKVSNCRISLLSVDTHEKLLQEVPVRMEQSTLVKLDKLDKHQLSTLHGPDKGWDSTAEAPTWDSELPSQKLTFQSLLEVTTDSCARPPRGSITSVEASSLSGPSSMHSSA